MTTTNTTTRNLSRKHWLVAIGLIVCSIVFFATVETEEYVFEELQPAVDEEINDACNRIEALYRVYIMPMEVKETPPKCWALIDSTEIRQIKEITPGMVVWVLKGSKITPYKLKKVSDCMVYSMHSAIRPEEYVPLLKIMREAFKGAGLE